MPSPTGTEVVAGVAISKYDPAKCLLIVSGLADGEKSLKDLCAEHHVARATFYRWLTMYPELRSAYAAAREVSAGEFEDKALAIARKLEDEKTITAPRVAAYKAAMEQYRWSASHRDPGSYGQHTQINIAVPVTITTPLDLGNGVTRSIPQTLTSENIYDLTAIVDALPQNEQDADGGDTADGGGETAVGPTGPDPFDTTSRAEPLVMKQKPGRRPKPDPRESGVAKRRAGHMRAKAARGHTHPRVAEILAQQAAKAKE